MKRKDEMELRGLVGGLAPVRPASSSRVPSSIAMTERRMAVERFRNHVAHCLTVALIQPLTTTKLEEPVRSSNR